MPAKEIIIKDWRGNEHTLHGILCLCEHAEKAECSFDDIMDGDLANTPSIIRGLIGAIRELQGE